MSIYSVNLLALYHVLGTIRRYNGLITQVSLRQASSTAFRTCATAFRSERQIRQSLIPPAPIPMFSLRKLAELSTHDPPLK